MELQRGTCFICRNSSVIKPSQSQKAHKIIPFLFKEGLNTTEFSNVQSALRICPICYHKLIVMKRTSKNVGKSISNDVSTNHCRLCKSEKNLFEISNWPSFSAISEDMGFLKKKNCVTCSDCLFYLEIKKELKTKLFSKYPQLENKSLNNNKNKKWKLKFSPDAKLQPTPLSEKNNRSKILRKRKVLETINISSDDDSKSDKTVLNPLKNLKPLKDHKLYKNNKTVKMDSKFLNQIPYVLVSSSDLSNKRVDTIGERAVIKHTEEGENENFKVRDENRISEKLKNELDKHNIDKHLVVNVSRMKINEYKGPESDPDIQTLIDKFSILHSSNETKINGNTNINNRTETEDSFVEETETSFEIKNKRKSVSFAEEKNVEIEYFENDSNIKFKNHNNSDEETEVISKKQSKGILKREDNTEEQNVTLEERNKNIKVKDKAYDKLSNKEGEEFKENAQNQEDDETTKIKIKNRRNSHMIDERAMSDSADSESDTENLSQILDKSKYESIEKKTELTNISESDENIVIEDTSHQDKEKIGKNKPKPLSKRKRQNKVTEDTNVDHPNDKNVASEDILEKDSDNDVTTTEQSLQNETKSEENKYNAEDDVESISADEKFENKTAKKEKPKPLSKKKRINVDKPDDDSVTREDMLEKSINCDVTTAEPSLENKTKSEENHKPDSEDNITLVSVDEKVENRTTRKEKPKPLSKKRKIDIDQPDGESVTSEDIQEKNNDCDAATAEKSLQNKTTSEENNKSNTEDNVASVSVEEKECRSPRKEKPKPLSKKKKLNDNSEDINKKEISSVNDKDDEFGNESVSEGRKVKKDKPKPLSKKKKLDDKSENIKADINFEDNLNKNKDEDLDDSNKEKSTDAENNSSKQDIQDTPSDLEEQILLRNENQLENSQSTDVVIETEKCTEENDATNSDSTEKEKDSLDSSIEDKSSANNSLDISEYCKEVEKLETDTVSNDGERDSNKPDTTSNHDVSQLVNKYLNNDQDGSCFLNTQKDGTVGKPTSPSSDEIQTDHNKVDNNSKFVCSTIETFNEFKNDDLGISEVDNENINSILSNMFPSELPDDKLFEMRNEKKPETDPAEDTNQDHKRKISDDELNTSKERKKKKVTFCDDVT